MVTILFRPYLFLFDKEQQYKGTKKSGCPIFFQYFNFRRINHFLNNKKQ